MRAVFVHDALIETAGKITVPVEYRIPWGEAEFGGAFRVALFGDFAALVSSLAIRIR